MNRARWSDRLGFSDLTAALCTLILFGVTAAQAAEPIMNHGHMPIAVPDQVLTPALSLKLEPDSMSGYNLELELEHYVLGSPPAGASMTELMAATVAADGASLTGHAHLYVNGQKVQRLYGTAVHIPAALLRDGENELTVTLNNHGHMYWSVGGTQVVATLFINTQRQPALLYHFASFPAGADSATHKGAKVASLRQVR